MEKVFKNVALLFIIHNDSILMRRFTHQDYEVIDVFAFSFKDVNDIDVGIKDKLMSLFGKTFPYHYHGNIESIINKEGVTAYITVKTYKVLLNEKQKVLDGYTDDVVKGGADTFWLDKSDIKNETRLRDGDRKTYERIFDDRNIDIKIVVDQGDRWIDAKTVVYEDR
jgi:hypothetical protein